MPTIHHVNKYSDDSTSCGIQYDDSIWGSTKSNEVNCRRCNKRMYQSLLNGKSRKQTIDQHWEVRPYKDKDAYNTSIPSLEVFRDGWLIAYGPIEGHPLHRTNKYIPKLDGLPESTRQRFMKKVSHD